MHEFYPLTLAARMGVYEVGRPLLRSGNSEQSGYVALYRFVASKDEVRILAIRHQRELGFQP
jgi:hypothetical protein